MCVISRFMKLILSFSLPWHSLMCRNFLVYFSNYQVIELLSFLYSIQLSSLWLYLWKPFFLWSPRALSQACRVPSKYGSWTSAHLASSVGSWSWVTSWSWMPYLLHFWHRYLAISVHHSRNRGSWLYTYVGEISPFPLPFSSSLSLPTIFPPSTIYLNALSFHKMLESGNHQGVSIRLRTEEEGLHMTKL